MTANYIDAHTRSRRAVYSKSNISEIKPITGNKDGVFMASNDNNNNNNYIFSMKCHNSYYRLSSCSNIQTLRKWY